MGAPEFDYLFEVNYRYEYEDGKLGFYIKNYLVRGENLEQVMKIVADRIDEYLKDIASRKDTYPHREALINKATLIDELELLGSLKV